MVSKRRYFERFYIFLLVMSALIPSSALVINHYIYKKEIIEVIVKYLLLLPLVTLVLLVTYFFIRYRSIKTFRQRRKILKSLEDNLISIGAYDKKESKVYADLPKIKIYDDEITINLKNLKIRKQIEQYINTFSTALNDNYVVEDVEITPNSNVLKIKFEDLGTYEQETYTFEEYKHLTSSLDKMSFYFDKKHIVNLNDYPHWMIVGSSGSGKSFFAQELLSQAIIKDFDCYVLDPKHTYGMYRNLTTYISDEMDILSTLKSIESEMNKRYSELEPLWDDNPGALAIDLGYNPIYVLVEEFSALQDGIDDKKDKEELKRIMRILSKKARQCSIHLCLVMQTGGVDVIESSTRSQFNKVLLGNAMNNIIKSTFQADMEEIPLTNFKNKGEGFIQLNRISIIRVPNVKNMEKIKENII